MHFPAKPQLTFLISIAMLLLAGAVLVPGAAAGGPAAEPGDVNCDGFANSIDAALILQFEAALKDSFACPDAGDVDGDGVVNSIDARIVLELDAGIRAGLVRMYLTVTEPASLCGVRAKPLACDIPIGSDFRLAVVLHSAPPEGYAGFQTQVFFDRLAYQPAAVIQDEVLWPDGPALRSTEVPGYVVNGALSSMPASRFRGPLVELSFLCSLTPSTHRLLLLAYKGGTNSLGSALVLPGPAASPEPAMTFGLADLDPLGEGDRRPVPIAHTLEINCV